MNQVGVGGAERDEAGSASSSYRGDRSGSPLSPDTSIVHAWRAKVPSGKAKAP